MEDFAYKPSENINLRCALKNDRSYLCEKLFGYIWLTSLSSSNHCVHKPLLVSRRAQKISVECRIILRKWGLLSLCFLAWIALSDVVDIKLKSSWRLFMVLIALTPMSAIGLMNSFVHDFYCSQNPSLKILFSSIESSLAVKKCIHDEYINLEAAIWKYELHTFVN